MALPLNNNNEMEWLSLLLGPIKTLWTWNKRPKPIFEFEYRLSKTEENPYCQFRRNTTADLPGWFFRLGINNKGETTIPNANVMVEKINSIDETGKETQFSSAPFFLHWANENTDNSRNLYQDTPVYIDLLYSVESKKDAFLYCKSKHEGAGIRRFLPIGIFLIHLKLVGDNIKPLKQRVKVSVNGGWETIVIQLID